MPVPPARGPCGHPEGSADRFPGQAFRAGYAHQLSDVLQRDLVDAPILLGCDPELIHEKYSEISDLVIDGGFGRNEASTIVDCTGDEIEVIRQGLGVLEL